MVVRRIDVQTQAIDGRENQDIEISAFAGNQPTQNRDGIKIQLDGCST